MTDPIRAKDTPVFIGASFVKRAQSFEAMRSQTVMNVREIGGTAYVGPIISPPDYNGMLRVLEVGQGTLTALGLATSWLTYVQSDPAGVAIGCVNGGLTGAVVKTFEIVLTLNRPVEEVFTLGATGWAAVATASPAPDYSLAPIMHADCSVDVGDNVQRVRIRGGATLQFVREVNDATNAIKGKIYTAPWAEVEVECLHPGVCAWIDDEAAAADITVTADTLTFAIGACVSAEEPHQGSVRGWTTNIYRYRSTSGEVSFS